MKEGTVQTNLNSLFFFTHVSVDTFSLYIKKYKTV